jgi:hypothetical protein
MDCEVLADARGDPGVPANDYSIAWSARERNLTLRPLLFGTDDFGNHAVGISSEGLSRRAAGQSRLPGAFFLFLKHGAIEPALTIVMLSASRQTGPSVPDPAPRKTA